MREKYINDGLDFVVEVKELWIVLFDLSGAIDSSLSLHGVELPFDWTIKEQVGLALLFILDWLIPQSFYKGLSLHCEVFSSVDCSGGGNFEASVEIDSALSGGRRTCSLRFASSVVCFFGGGWMSFLFYTMAA